MHRGSPRRAGLAAGAALLAVALQAAAQGLDADPRMERPALPRTVAEAAARFLPIHEQLGPPARWVLDEAENAEFELTTVAGACYAVIATSNSVRDVDVRVRSQGAIVAQDVQRDAYPVVRWCARETGAVIAEVRAYLGSGTGEIAFFVEPNSAEHVRGDRDELSNRVDAQVARSAPRWTPAADQWRRLFSAPEIVAFELETGPHSCAAVVGVGEASVLDLDLSLVDAQGVEVSRDVAPHATPVVVWCGVAAETLTVRVAVTHGSGAVAVQALTHPSRL